MDSKAADGGEALGWGGSARPERLIPMLADTYLWSKRYFQSHPITVGRQSTQPPEVRYTLTVTPARLCTWMDTADNNPLAPSNQQAAAPSGGLGGTSVPGLSFSVGETVWWRHSGHVGPTAPVGDSLQLPVGCWWLERMRSKADLGQVTEFGCLRCYLLEAYLAPTYLGTCLSNCLL